MPALWFISIFRSPIWWQGYGKATLEEKKEERASSKDKCKRYAPVQRGRIRDAEIAVWCWWSAWNPGFGTRLSFPTVPDRDQYSATLLNCELLSPSPSRHFHSVPLFTPSNLRNASNRRTVFASFILFFHITFLYFFSVFFSPPLAPFKPTLSPPPSNPGTAATAFSNLSHSSHVFRITLRSFAFRAKSMLFRHFMAWTKKAKHFFCLEKSKNGTPST